MKKIFLFSGLLQTINARLFILLIVLTLSFSLVAGDLLFSPAGLQSMAGQLPELGLLSLAMMVSLLSGGIDLSIIATANLSALMVAFILVAIPPEAEGVVLIAWQLGACLAGLATALSVGVLNGLLIGYLRVSPILATLGTMTLVKGLGVGLSHGSVISGFPAAIVFLGNGSLFSIPMPLILFLLIAMPMAIILGRTPLGLTILLFGSNERSLRFSGVNSRAMAMRIYTLSAVLAFAAGLVMMARFNSANAAYGESYLLITILACVLGGIHPAGGFGKVSGLLLALIILQIISTACSIMGVSQFLTLALWGAILIAASAWEALSVKAPLHDLCRFFRAILSGNRFEPQKKMVQNKN